MTLYCVVCVVAYVIVGVCVLLVNCVVCRVRGFVVLLSSLVFVVLCVLKCVVVVCCCCFVCVEVCCVFVLNIYVYVFDVVLCFWSSLMFGSFFFVF